MYKFFIFIFVCSGLLIVIGILMRNMINNNKTNQAKVLHRTEKALYEFCQICFKLNKTLYDINRVADVVKDINGRNVSSNDFFRRVLCSALFEVMSSNFVCLEPTRKLQTDYKAKLAELDRVLNLAGQNAARLSSQAAIEHIGGCRKVLGQFYDALDNPEKLIELEEQISDLMEQAKLFAEASSFDGNEEAIADCDYYKSLEIESAATEAEIKSAFRRLSKLYHPDLHEQLAPDLKNFAAARFREINEAYQVLCNTTTRARYDNKMG